MSLKPGEIAGAGFYVVTIFFALMLAAWAASCGDGAIEPPLCVGPPVDPVEAYVVGGLPSTNRRSTVYVVGGGSCTGTIVGPHTVLSAAHCGDLNDILVEGVAWYEPVLTITHPDYFFPQHDLTLTYVDEVLPEPYTTIGLELDGTCDYLLVQGYGVGSEGALHERVVFETGRGFGIIRTSEGTCNGDSGGPLYALQSDGSYTLVGVTSFGSSEPYVCIGGINGFVDLTVPENYDWIKENTQ